MKKQLKLLALLTTATTILFFNSGVNAANDIVINVHEDQCHISTSYPDGNNCDNNRCDGISECICASKGEHILWVSDSDGAFGLDFGADSPLKKNCGKHSKSMQQKCVVKDDLASGSEFNYNINFDKCDQPFDPKIVIK